MTAPTEIAGWDRYAVGLRRMADTIVALQTAKFPRGSTHRKALKGLMPWATEVITAFDSGTGNVSIPTPDQGFYVACCAWRFAGQIPEPLRIAVKPQRPVQ